MTDIDPLIGATPAEGVPATDVHESTPVGGVPIVRRGRRRLSLKIVAALLALLGVYYLFTLWQVHRAGQLDQRRPAEAIVVMGAAQYDGRPSPQLAARLDHAAELWHDDVASLVVVTGGKREGDRFTEAEASGRYLADRGVEVASIVEINAGSNSYDSLVGARDQLRILGLRRVVLVSDPYHMLRVRLIAEELGLDAEVSATPSTTVRGWAARRRELKEAAGVSLGRIIGFHRLLSLTG